MFDLFAPIPGGTVVLAATTTTGPKSLGQKSDGSPLQVRVYNDGTTLAYIEFGDSTVTATTSSIPIPPGVACGFTVRSAAKDTQRYFAAIMASSTANISVTPGFGI